MKHSIKTYVPFYCGEPECLRELSCLSQCVDDFALAMKSKLNRKRIAGKTGWDDPSWPREDIIRKLREHLEKGDMIDVANFAMFAWNQETQPEP